jgi:hypothetical protein
MKVGVPVHTRKGYREVKVGVYLHSFLISALDLAVSSTPRPLYYRECVPGTSRTAGWEALDKRNIFLHCYEYKDVSSVHKPVA